MKKLISLLMTIAVLLSVLQPAWAIEEAAEIDAVAASRNLIVVVPGIIGSELVDGNGAKVWVGVGGILGQIQCNEVGNPVYPLYAYNNDNYGARDTYKTLYDSLKSRCSSQADVKFFAYDWRKTNTRAGLALKSMVNGYSGKIIIVAHSMGGIVASDYLRIATESQRTRTTLITLGTPFTGAPKAVQVMENGKMFPGIVGDLTSSYIQNLIRNIPAAYELLPTTRSTAYVQVNGVDQTATNAWNILKQRSWANFQSGSGLKPMMDTARNFHANLMQSNNQHYALSAGRSVFITSTGYTTVQKVNYSLSGGQYSVSSYIGTNDGDGTVPSTSAQNRLSNTDTHVVRVVNAGNHTDMVSNPNTLTKVYQYVSQTLAGNSLSAIEENEVGNTHVNEKGWVVGEGIDGRRVRVIIRGSSMPTIVSSTGEPYTLIGEQLYVGDEAIEDNYVGECWEVSDGYQFEMMRGAHKFVYDDDTKEGFSVEVSYMENGYYEAMQTYEIKETEGTYELSTWESVQKQPEMTVNNGIVVEEVEPSSIFNGLELQRLNVD